MNKRLLILLGIVCIQMQAQSTFNSSQYAAVGDNFYLTSANNLALDYETTGTNFVWDFSSLTGTSQSQLQHRNPTSTGFLWLFIYNPNNTNLAATNNNPQTLNIPGQVVELTDSYDFYKKSSTDLRQTGSASKVNYNGTQIPITNQYTDSDIIYRFPIQFGNLDTDNSAYTINIPTLLYQENTLERTNEVDGWGSLSTPYGNYSNILRMKTTLVANDSIALLDTGLPRTIRTTREFKWFDTTQKIPVLKVTQSNTAGNWVTTNVEYLDSQRDFQTTALFTYAPLNPSAGDTVYFQNLSTNATTFTWNFDDPSSGAENTSTEEFPTHVFAADGVYTVQLTASNGTFTATYDVTIVVGNLGISQFDLNAIPAVYPNPFSSKFKLNKPLQNAQYVMSSIDGQIVFSEKNIEDQDFSYLPTGVYILSASNSEEIVQYKLIKQ
ncbi:MAG: T9SS type A sorting domain-containing protein [Flavobacterium sp.]|nr:T9SS type A sorting domain-containing protein [Flavobacterium sp.]